MAQPSKRGGYKQKSGSQKRKKEQPISSASNERNVTFSDVVEPSGEKKDHVKIAGPWKISIIQNADEEKAFLRYADSGFS